MMWHPCEPKCKTADLSFCPYLSRYECRECGFSYTNDEVAEMEYAEDAGPPMKRKMRTLAERADAFWNSVAGVAFLGGVLFIVMWFLTRYHSLTLR